MYLDELIRLTLAIEVDIYGVLDKAAYPAWKPWQYAVHTVLTKPSNLYIERDAISDDVLDALFSNQALLMADFLRRGELASGVCGPGSDHAIIEQLHRAAPSVLLDDWIRLSATSPRHVWRMLPPRALDGKRPPEFAVEAMFAVLDNSRLTEQQRRKSLAEIMAAAGDLAQATEFRALMHVECERRDVLLSELGL
ncbi:hypothetical protein H9P43_007618 [Blastocladiella emersonii ATCC 22665]|nr:hypothetical protein H9P43_007618 [Blastocladiella emersonii ATCC 22665]